MWLRSQTTPSSPSLRGPGRPVTSSALVSKDSLAGFGEQIQTGTFGAFTARFEAFNAVNAYIDNFGLDDAMAIMVDGDRNNTFKLRGLVRVRGQSALERRSVQGGRLARGIDWLWADRAENSARRSREAQGFFEGPL